MPAGFHQPNKRGYPPKCHFPTVWGCNKVLVASKVWKMIGLLGKFIWSCKWLWYLKCWFISKFAKFRGQVVQSSTEPDCGGPTSFVMEWQEFLILDGWVYRLDTKSIYASTLHVTFLLTARAGPSNTSIIPFFHKCHKCQIMSSVASFASDICQNMKRV